MCYTSLFDAWKKVAIWREKVPTVSVHCHDHIRTCFVYGGGVMRGRQAQCREPKTGQQKAQLYYEGNPLCPSGYIIYIACTVYCSKSSTAVELTGTIHDTAAILLLY